MVSILMAASPLLHGAEQLESLRTREGREYFKVEILSNDDVGIRIRHEAGTARIAFQNLPADLQAKYHYDPKKAAAQKEMESKAQLEQEANDPLGPDGSKGRSPVPTKSDAGPSPAVAEPNPTADEVDLQKLEAYIVKMKLNVETAGREAARLRSQAMSERMRMRNKVKGYDNRGQAVSETVQDKSGQVKADKLTEQAVAIERQILQARVLIGTAEAKYNRLTGNPNSPAPLEKSVGASH